MLEGKMEFNGLVFNDQTKAQPLNDYWIKATSVDGVFGDEIRYESHPLPCGTGERSADALRSGKSIVISGIIYGLNLEQLREGQWALMQACWDLKQYKLLFQPWKLKRVPDRMYWKVKVNQPLVMTDEISTDRWNQRSFTVGFRADDPRSYLESTDAIWPSWQV